MRRVVSLGIIGIALVLAKTGAAAEGATPPAVDFQREIRPILFDHCVRCHGPDPEQRKADLRLDTRHGAFGRSSRGAIVVPGDREASLLWRKLSAADPDERMPPAGAKKPLDAREVELLGRWIDEGAEWSEHWAFVPPKVPPIPAVERPSWARNAIDRFVLARLEAAGIEPSPEADRRTLIRRVTLTLTGLPPSPEDVERFVADERPGAYERLVERLLASPRFGERMALQWMDAARYGDSSVYHADGVRDMWPWRDWVIRAYNDGMPFDRFTVEQIAGDLLPGATTAQRIATGFHRNHGTTDEGGAIPEEYRVEYVVDRVKTTATVWMGLTLECGQCHSHKYDPISQREYYAFYAYFNRSKDEGLQTRNGNAPPFVSVLSPDDERMITRWHESADRLRERLATERPPPAEIARWIEDERSAGGGHPTLGPWRAVGPFRAANQAEAFAKEFGPEHDSAPGASYGDFRWEERPDAKDGAVVDLSIPSSSAIYLAREIESPRRLEVELSLGSDDGIHVWLRGEKVHANNVFRGPAAPDQERVKLALEAGTNSLLIKVNNGGGPSSFYFRFLGDTTPEEVRALLAREPQSLALDERARLETYYVENVWEVRRKIAAKLEELRAREESLRASAPTSMVLEDQENPRPTYVLRRGNYASPLEDQVIEPGVPSCLPPLPSDAPPNRLALARWLVDPGHPLTARVAVNRYWQLLFGRGIVSTPEDFGVRGAPPSHPALLDWLARDFSDHGWDVKRTIRAIVLSATYRQSSRVTPELRARDPLNVLLSRGPRFRLEGEFIRDQALALSGLLQGTIGGPSTKPYQPPGIWNEVSLDGGLRYAMDSGGKLYRRSLYIYWKRSAPMPSLLAFDAPTREKCSVERQRTNTPLQALVTLNDVQYVEAARVFARQILREAGPSTGDRLDFAFLLATARPADPLRHEILGDLLEGRLEEFRAHPERASALLDVGEYPRDASLDPAEHAAWTVVASAILNLDEVLTNE